VTTPCRFKKQAAPAACSTAPELHALVHVQQHVNRKDPSRRDLDDNVPLAIRSHDTLGAGFLRRIRRQLANRISHAAYQITRASVRFEDINGPKGGVDTVCRIKLVILGRPTLVVEKRAASHALAFASAVTALGTAIERTRRKPTLRPTRRAQAHKPTSAIRPAKPIRASTQADEGELIGRRVGHGPEALARALERPEKTNRAAYTDTAAPGVSASDRRAGGNSTARRNTLARTTRATAMLEDSRTRPSRKSTRRSANRAKPSQMKERAAAARIHTPKARARHGS
jgi:hypothetical protein